MADVAAENRDMKKLLVTLEIEDPAIVLAVERDIAEQGNSLDYADFSDRIDDYFIDAARVKDVEIVLE